MRVGEEDALSNGLFFNSYLMLNYNYVFIGDWL